MSAGPVHQPGAFNIEAFVGDRWHGGMNRLTRESAIETAQAWAEQDGRRHRVFDLDGKVIFDTDAGPVDVLAVMAADARAARADRLAQARMSSHSVEESQRAQALWSRSIDARAAVAELIEAARLLVAESVHPYDGGEYEGGEWIALDRARAALARVGGAA